MQITGLKTPILRKFRGRIEILSTLNLLSKICSCLRNSVGIFWLKFVVSVQQLLKFLPPLL